MVAAAADEGSSSRPTTAAPTVHNASMAVTFALVLAVFAVGVDTYIVAALLPAVADDLQSPIAAVGLLASAYALPTALLAPVFGPISDRRGRRFALMLGLGIFIARRGRLCRRAVAALPARGSARQRGRRGDHHAGRLRRRRRSRRTGIVGPA